MLSMVLLMYPSVFASVALGVSGGSTMLVETNLVDAPTDLRFMASRVLLSKDRA